MDLNLFFTFLLSLPSCILKVCPYPPCCDPAQQIPGREPVFSIVYYSHGCNPTSLLPPPPTFFLGILCPFIPTSPFSSQSNIFFKSAACPVCSLPESLVSSQLTLTNVPPSSPTYSFPPRPWQTSLGDRVSLPSLLPPRI